MQPGIATLRALPVFSDLNHELLRRLDEISSVVIADHGTELCSQGDLPRSLFYVVDGQVALSTTAPDGTRAVVEVVRPTGNFVLATVMSGLPYLQSAHVVQHARLVVIDAEELRDLAVEQGELAMALMRSLSQDVRGLVRQIRDLKVRTTAQRLGAYLLALVPDPLAGEAEFKLPFEKGLLAARLGCRQENLSRAFATLREMGVETRGSRVWLSDIPKLTTYSSPDYLNDSELARAHSVHFEPHAA
jgi:CRP/FNR family transcriptional regulator, transcriptional activator FtrB